MASMKIEEHIRIGLEPFFSLKYFSSQPIRAGANCYLARLSKLTLLKSSVKILHTSNEQEY